MPHALTIGKLATATGVNVETIRYNERAGLIAPPARTEGNYRSYQSDDMARLRFIRRTRDLGFSLDQVRALLSISGQRERDCGSVDTIATEHLAQVGRKLADLAALRRELADAVASCQGGTVAECRILEAFSPPNLRRTPPLATNPSVGAQISTVQRPSNARVGRTSGSYLVCRTPRMFSRFTNRLARPRTLARRRAATRPRGAGCSGLPSLAPARWRSPAPAR